MGCRARMPQAAVPPAAATGAIEFCCGCRFLHLGRCSSIPGVIRRLSGCLFASLLLACSSEPRQLQVDITLGYESDALTQAPAVVQVDIEGFDSSNGRIVAASAEPGGSFELGELPRETFVRFDLQGLDADGEVRVRGRSLGFVLNELAAESFPIFAQRSNSWARPPQGLSAGYRRGFAAAVGERFLMLAGGEFGAEASADEKQSVSFYDLLSLSPGSPGKLAFQPHATVVSADGQATLFVGLERALWVDFGSGETTSIDQPPSGLDSFAELAGARAWRGDGASYLVAAAGDTSSDKVLVVSDDRSLSIAKLNTARKLAAIAWVPERGLVVAAGSSSGSGLEVLDPATGLFVERPFPSDATMGAAVVALSSAKLLQLGGSNGADAAATRELDLLCSSNCQSQDTGIVSGEVVRSQRAYRLDPNRILLVGEDAAEFTRSYLVDLGKSSSTEVLLKEPRRWASVVATPLGTVAIVGGYDVDGAPVLSIESFFPSP